MMTTVTRVTPVGAYKRMTRATERYMEERLWQRALARLDGPRQAPPKKKRSFAEVLRAVRGKLGRHVDIYV
ncbi:MAG: hypothetical protein VW600_19725 [Ferrovibrio sp.]